MTAHFLEPIDAGNFIGCQRLRAGCNRERDVLERDIDRLARPVAEERDVVRFVAAARPRNHARVERTGMRRSIAQRYAYDRWSRPFASTGTGSGSQ